MRITKKLAAAGVAGVLGVTGIAVLAPVASATTSEESVGGRLAALTEALAGLVTDGTLTQAQADEVASTLEESDLVRGHGGPGGWGGWGGHGGRGGLDLDAAAEALGVTTEELRTALAVDGATLADVAAAEGVEVSTLVDALVASGTERLEQAVTDGRLTREEADERIAALPERVAALVERELRGGGFGRGLRGGAPKGFSGDDGGEGGATDDAATRGSAVGSA